MRGSVGGRKKCVVWTCPQNPPLVVCPAFGPPEIQPPLSYLQLNCTEWGALTSALHQVPPADIRRDFYQLDLTRGTLIRWHASGRVRFFTPENSRLPAVFDWKTSDIGDGAGQPLPPRRQLETRPGPKDACCRVERQDRARSRPATGPRPRKPTGRAVKLATKGTRNQCQGGCGALAFNCCAPQQGERVSQKSPLRMCASQVLEASCVVQHTHFVQSQPQTILK